MSKHRVPIPPVLKDALQGNPFLGRQLVYKFHHTKHSDSFYRDGKIKIGTLSGYRAIENSALKDQSEGLDITGIPQGTKVAYSDIHSDSGFRRLFNSQAQHVFFENLTVITAPEDLYVYCFSYECSRDVLQSFDGNDPLDRVACCVDIFAVADLVCEYHPILRGFSYLCLPVVYRPCVRGASEPSADLLESCFEKPREFSANKEGRIVFIPPGGVLRGGLHLYAGGPGQSGEPPVLNSTELAQMAHSGRLSLDLWQHSDFLKLFRPASMPSSG
jgi:hypothetical protein